MKIAVKLSAICALLIVGLVGAWIKSGMLQLGRGAALKELAVKQADRHKTVQGLRGNIYDRNGEVLAISLWSDSIFAEPRRFEDPKKTVQALKKLLGSLPDSTIERLQDKDRGFAWVARRADPNAVAKLTQKPIKGIGLVPEERRFYPNHGLMGQLLGLVSIDGLGAFGVEQSFQQQLAPKKQNIVAKVDARGANLVTDASPPAKALAGDNIHLTIDRNIQQVAEEAIFEAVSHFKAKGGWALAINPKTGELLALANVPLMNPNQPQTTSLASRRNNALSFTGEPGSTFKMISFAAALEAKVVKPDDLFDCQDGEYKLGRFTIKDISKHGIIPVRDIFRYSSNVGTLKIAQLVGKEKLHQTIKAFGFGESPGLGMIEEAGGYVSPPAKWDETRFVNVSFGYGLMASPLQMLMAVATVANKGVRMPPKLIAQIKGSDGQDKTPKDERKPTRVMSEEAALQLKELMVWTTHQGGTGVRAHIDGIEIAGKSGTAEKVDPQTKRYDKSKNRSSFIGFAPADDPQVAVFVVIDEPKSASYGGLVAAPAWRKIVLAALN